MRTTCELIDIVRDLDCEAVVQVACQDEHRLVEAIPKFNQLLPFLEEDSPCIVLLYGSLLVLPSPAADVRNHEVDGGDHENEIRLALANPLLEPIELLLPDHGGLWVVGFVDVVEASVRARVQKEKIAI